MPSHHPVRGSPAPVVDKLHPVRGSPTPFVDTLHSVAQIAKTRGKSGRMTSPQPLTEIGQGKRLSFANNVKRTCFSDSGASQTVEDLRGRPTAVAVTEHWLTLH